MTASFTNFILSIGLFCASLTANAGYKTYKPDLKPLTGDQALHSEWQRLTKQYQDEGITKANIQARLGVILPLIKKNPKWTDGRWLLANLYMQLGETVSADDGESKDLARAVLTKVKKHTERCLQLDKNLDICKFFLGAAIGKIATIDGILASLGQGKQILALWNDVLDGRQQYIFDDGYSLQSLVHYALGIFYRVVPDVFILRWVMGFSGDIDKSVEMHRKSVELPGGGGACSYLMLTAALLCQADGEVTAEAKSFIGEIKMMKTDGDSEAICVRDAAKLERKPADGCGYTKAQQQERSEEAMKAKLKK